MRVSSKTIDRERPDTYMQKMIAHRDLHHGVATWRLSSIW